MKVKDLFQERGHMLENFVTLDTVISMIIAKHYLGNNPEPHKEADFLLNVMGNSQCTYAFKKNVLQHILKTDNLDGSNIDELDRLNRLRNIFAHKQHVSQDTVQTPESEVFFINPRFPFDRTKNFSAESLKSQFNSIFPYVLNWLYNLAKNKGYDLPETGSGIIKQDKLPESPQISNLKS